MKFADLLWGVKKGFVLEVLHIEDVDKFAEECRRDPDMFRPMGGETE